METVDFTALKGMAYDELLAVYERAARGEVKLTGERELVRVPTREQVRQMIRGPRRIREAVR